MHSIIKTIVLSATISALVAWVVSNQGFSRRPPTAPTEQELIAEFYQIENAVYVSPHSLRRRMDQGETNFTLVDLRSPQEYAKAHVTGAVNIPAYMDPNTPAYEEVDRIVAAFQQLPAGKEVVVYCYSMPCMTGRKIGKLLAEREIFVKHLGIGWNEWRHFWTLWNHEHEWETTKPEEYITSGTEPGTPKNRELPSPCGSGEFSC